MAFCKNQTNSTKTNVYGVPKITTVILGLW